MANAASRGLKKWPNPITHLNSSIATGIKVGINRSTNRLKSDFAWTGRSCTADSVRALLA